MPWLGKNGSAPFQKEFLFFPPTNRDREQTELDGTSVLAEMDSGPVLASPFQPIAAVIIQVCIETVSFYVLNETEFSNGG